MLKEPPMHEVILTLKNTCILFNPPVSYSFMRGAWQISYLEHVCYIALPLMVLLHLHVWGILPSLGPAPAHISHATAHVSLFIDTNTHMCIHTHTQAIS